MLDISRSSIKKLISLICLFVILDIMVLALNFMLTVQLEQDAREINIAGRQRMLSQEIGKTVLLLDLHLKAGEYTKVAVELDKLQYATEVFDQTLRSFDEGGTTPDAAGVKVPIRAVEGAIARRVVDAAMHLWLPWHASIVTFLAGRPTINTHATTALIEKTVQTNDDVRLLMNTLTIYLESDSKNAAQNIRYFQGLTFVFALLNFVFIIRQFFSHLALTRAGKRFLEKIVNNVDVAILMTKQGHIVSCNQSAEEIFSRSKDVMLGLQIDSLLEKGDRCSKVILPPSSNVKKVTYVEVSTKEVRLNGEIFLIYTVADISSQKVIETYLSELAFIDPLTDLCNRQMVDRRLKQEINRCSHESAIFSLLFIDLDGFKQVNDQYGHDLGDQVLKNVAQLLTNTVRQSDVVGRLGGDEFLVICSHASAKGVEELASKLIERICSLTTVDGCEICLGASIGIATYPADGDTAQLLRKNADKAMYAAKSKGKGCYCLVADI
ncbi:MAG: diguanylate cyclase [Hahellaceae bacterium]|nr:diguanylate cyclase [Hahellaceae bacterium]MCP5212982.1 diguanylate cyclase [Hahellaceae bacterium]